MTKQTDFPESIATLIQEVVAIATAETPAQINTTADRLERLNYAPPVHLSLDVFLHLTSTQVIDEIGRINKEAPNSERNSLDQKLQKISILVFYYKELSELRRGTAEAWDEVDELYVHD